MNRHFVILLIVFTLCSSVLLGLGSPANAQDSLDIVTFQQLRDTEIQLAGPYDAAGFAFGLPNNWKLTGGTELNLSMGVSFNIPDRVEAPYTPQFYGGTLTVFMNGEILAVLPLNEVGEIERNIPIPIDTFTPILDDGQMFIRFVLNSSSACRLGSDEQMLVFIHLDSNFALPHEFALPPTDLVNFPRPIFQNTFIPDSALLVIPDNPSSAELQGALTVSAGLGNLTDNELILDVVTASELTTRQRETSHLIYVGKSNAIPELKELQLPLRHNSSGQFLSSGGSNEDGVIQMINSPWSDAHVILVVSGNTDQGTIKAAQAVSTGRMRANRFSNLAIVQEVETTPVLVSQPTDQNFADLGYEDLVFEDRGLNAGLYNFYIPPGQSVTEEAYLELAYSHSALLNYDRSGIVAILNDQPFGSIRLNDTSASQPDNRVQIPLPVSAIVPGTNTLVINTNLVPYDNCTPPGMRGLWVGVLSESKLHLPLTPSMINPVRILDLTAYPEPFIHSPTLDTTAFILPKDDLDNWRNAALISAYLGSRANGPLTALSVFYDGELPETERTKYNLIVMGRPSKLSIMGEINASLPAPFLNDSDMALESNLQVTYRIPPDSPLGYVELTASPWKGDNVVLALLGNTTQGTDWAASALVQPELRGQLVGNFAVINDKQVIASDTRLPTSEMVPATSLNPNPLAMSPTVELNVRPTPPASWIMPALIGSISIFVLALAILVIGNWSRNRARHNPNK